jgi:hypothetical protein
VKDDRSGFLLPTIRVLSNSPRKVNKARLEAGKGGKGWQAVQKAAVKALMERRPS